MRNEIEVGKDIHISEKMCDAIRSHLPEIDGPTINYLQSLAWDYKLGLPEERLFRDSYRLNFSHAVYCFRIADIRGSKVKGSLEVYGLYAETGDGKIFHIEPEETAKLDPTPEIHFGIQWIDLGFKPVALPVRYRFGLVQGPVDVLCHPDELR